MCIAGLVIAGKAGGMHATIIQLPWMAITTNMQPTLVHRQPIQPYKHSSIHTSLQSYDTFCGRHAVAEAVLLCRRCPRRRSGQVRLLSATCDCHGAPQFE
jgi:hypothetical protein